MAGLHPVSGSAADVERLLASWLEADDPEPLAIETSGSTGRPKRVLLSRDAVLASAHAAHERLGGPGRWTLLLPPTYVAGVQVIVRALLAGQPLEHELHDPAERAYVSVVPTQLHRMLGDTRQRDALAAHAAVLVGGAGLDPALRERAEDASVHVVTTYGMSETAGGCVYDGRALGGVEVGIGDDGRVRLAGPVLFDGYEADPEATAAVRDGAWFRTEDLGEITPDGRLRVLGRADEVILSGGVNVPAPAVARRLRAHPQVAAAEVVGVPDPEWGELVMAVLVIAGGDVDLETVRDWVGAEQPRAWAPRGLIRVEELPLLGNGKVDRLAVRELAGADR